MKALHLFFLTVFVAATAAAQPVYETQGKDGPVFSDLPSQGRDVLSPGATELTLPPINVGSPPPAPPAAPTVQAAPVATVAPYQSLSISQPDNGGTIHTNTGQFTLQVVTDPELRTSQGDVLVVSLDGHPLPTTRTTARFDISPSEWQMAAGDSVGHQLQVSVVNSAGTVLITSAPVSFYVHRATRR